MKKLLLTALISGFAGGAGAAGVVYAQAAGGYSIRDMRFDESVGGKRPLPQVPKSWVLVSVTGGAKANTNNLFFRDKGGAIYIVQVHENNYGGFWTTNDVIKLNVDPKK